MKTTTIRELKHATTAVLRRVAAGESIEVRRRNQLVAILSPPRRPGRVRQPDFSGRLREVYGTTVLPLTATDLIGKSRGER